MASSCHLSMDLLCQEMRDGRAQSLWILLAPCVRSAKEASGTVTAAKPFSHRGPAATTKERDVVREMEKERERRALLSFASWPGSFESFDVRHGVLVERGFSFLLLPLCGVHSSERIFNALM